MKITFEEDDIEAAERMTHCDNVFGLLWEINQHCRDRIKYADLSDDVVTELETIRKMICDSALLDLYQ
jgi:hypothetical protein